ncbi:hypothetical protein G647_05715 [Cladophialophora carrionii CBS 160.54]|uniref:Uncharacterized protein n=1 Tax=Cladophialophora carrionii CBS 160.54 TaxID=1279043 RepID=V9DC83_9EURO|nr:uncharacterized protein G647_05715 [Cladophialophora carrionii CBS 160.54]ETI23908.1 hypothetical protein G647_05715 [Cladophialophora carrionii CBS 160.54]
MFNENFSFGSAPNPTALQFSVEECTSADISPFTSRCSTPHSSHGPLARRDSRFDAYRSAPRHGSVTALTAQLQSHVLDDLEMRSPSPPPIDMASPSDSSSTMEDEGYCEGADTPTTTVSDFSYDSNEIDPTLWDLSMSDAMVATSSPRPSLSLEAQALSSYTMRRRQRQALVRLQCLASRTPDLAMLIEECHPSSLPFETGILKAHGPSRGRKDSSSSVSGLGICGSGSNSGRIEKERTTPLVVSRKSPRMRKRTS